MKAPFVDGIATFTLRKRGSGFAPIEWSIGCCAANDTDETIRAHVANHWPQWEVSHIVITPVAQHIAAQEQK